jgi:transcriptional regulator with XRE-family HTH domain
MKNETIQKLVGERIRANRKQHGLNQAAVAKYIGLSRVSVVNIEQGAHATSLSIIYRLCTLFECQPADLLPPVSHSLIPESLLAGINELPADKQVQAKQLIRNLLIE